MSNVFSAYGPYENITPIPCKNGSMLRENTAMFSLGRIKPNRKYL